MIDTKDKDMTQIEDNRNSLVEHLRSHEPDELMMVLFEHIAKNKKPLEPEFQKVLYDNLCDLLSD